MQQQHEGFGHKNYLVRRKIFKLVGAAFHVFGPDGGVVFYSKQKAFKLKEDIRLFTGEDMVTEVLNIQARRILDFSAAYDVFDSGTGQKIGALKRKGLKSIVRDEWIIMDPMDNDIGLLQEDSTMMALLRRLLTNLIPQKFAGTVMGEPVCVFKQNFNPFVLKLSLDFTPDVNNRLDRRLGVAAGVLLAAIEQRQD